MLSNFALGLENCSYFLNGNFRAKLSRLSADMCWLIDGWKKKKKKKKPLFPTESVLLIQCVMKCLAVLLLHLLMRLAIRNNELSLLILELCKNKREQRETDRERERKRWNKERRKLPSFFSNMKVFGN